MQSFMRVSLFLVGLVLAGPSFVWAKQRGCQNSIFAPPQPKVGLELEALLPQHFNRAQVARRLAEILTENGNKPARLQERFEQSLGTYFEIWSGEKVWVVKSEPMLKSPLHHHASIEFNTPPLLEEEEILESARILEQLGAEFSLKIVEEETGLHAHVDYEDASDEEIAQLLRAFSAVQESFMSSFKVDAHRQMRYARPLPPRYLELLQTSLAQGLALEATPELREFLMFKNQALNVAPLFQATRTRPPTAELRLFNSTLVAGEIATAAFTAQSFVHAARYDFSQLLDAVRAKEMAELFRYFEKLGAQRKRAAEARPAF
jgi:hypothetical protein